MPQDIAMVGFDDFDLAEALAPPLTVVAQSTADLARSATELLFKQIDRLQQGEGAEYRPVKTLFPTTLIIRESCGCTSQR